MKKVASILFPAFLCLSLAPQAAVAQGAAPELFGVGEVIINYTKFTDANASDSCGLAREQLASVFTSSFAGTTVPAVAMVDAKPQMVGVARIQLIPEVSTYVDENLNCASWISLSAESRIRAVIPPVTAPRNVTAIYWRQHNKVVSGQSLHPQKVADVVRKMVEQFSQQYRLDQPVALQK
ncbi:MAG: hypothetical protein WC521_03415 [Bdellovibrionales bacterium]